MEKETVIRPSLLSADFTDLERDLSEMVTLGITHCHFDVMDGTFVENISFGEPLFKSLSSRYQNALTFDVHLMTVSPLRQTEQFYAVGAREISFHYEALSGDDLETAKTLKKEYPDLKLGLAVSPETDISLVLGLTNTFDDFLIMSVVPGKGGQSYIPGSEKKIARLAQVRKLNHLRFLIGVDGGINDVTGPLCYEAGADYLVCGSYYFKSPDRRKALDAIRNGFVRKPFDPYHPEA
jgi:ribulose-phosphate 3-epimerase